MPVVVGHDFGSSDLSIPGMPAFNPMMLLHGEETVENFKTIEPDITYLISP